MASLQHLPPSTSSREQLPVNLLGSLHVVRHRWVRFRGDMWHAAEPYEGHRVSLTYFCPAYVDRVPASVWKELRASSFPIPEHPEKTESWQVPR
eukprot:432902-Amphidinium_carterae.2